MLPALYNDQSNLHPRPVQARAIRFTCCRTLGMGRWIAAVAVLTATCSGCTGVNRTLSSVLSTGTASECIEAHRNESCARKAWFRREHNFCDQAYLNDFRDGFIAGYVAILDGKPGCPPAIPPKAYWGWASQSAEGQARMAAWFAGYPYGVQAAKDDGVNQWNALQLSPQFEQKYGMRSSSSNSGQYGSPNGTQQYYDGSSTISPNAAPTPVTPSDSPMIDMVPDAADSVSPFPVIE